ncbi:MAG: hypothetical protein MUD14_15250 [Hydrococcus sp. Prado102]|jgi:hypothetical protein|nr:hypothetical protein [Hydrococcus sp. Prado102]
MFLVFAFFMWRRKDPDAEQSECDRQKPFVSFSKTMLSAFLVIFAAEWVGIILIISH